MVVEKSFSKHGHGVALVHLLSRCYALAANSECRRQNTSAISCKVEARTLWLLFLAIFHVLIMHLYQLYAPLPPSRAIVGNEGDVLLQNVAPVVGHLPIWPFSIDELNIWISTSWCLILCRKSSSVCTVCENDCYLHSRCRQSNPLCQPRRRGGKICPRVGEFHIY